MVAAYERLTKPIVDLWVEQFASAEKVKEEFSRRGAQVEQFYSGAAGFMFETNYMNKFLAGAGATIDAPKFKSSFNKGFEFIAVMWPMLFWQMADRRVHPYRSMPFDPAVLAGGDPNMLQMVSGLMDQQAEADAKAVMRSQVQERVLNLLPKIQPPGGLIKDASIGVFEALLKGCGFLVTEPYRFPESERNLVGSFQVSVDDVLVDATCRDPHWDDASWISIKHRHRPDQVEQKFNLPPGSMRQYTNKAAAQRALDTGKATPVRGESAADNMVTWYEVYSRAGLGNKLSANGKIHPELDDVVGDYVYLCICPACPWPLNLSAIDMEQETADDEWAREAVRWPTEYWRHNKWPISMLQFYPHSGCSPWPEPPLSPAIGELTAVNLLISVFLEKTWDNRQDILAVFKDRVKNLKELLRTEKGTVVIELNDSLDKSVADVLSFAQRPGVNGDVFKCIEFLFGLIEQRTGMVSQYYGGGGGSANSRSKAEWEGRQANVAIRPDFMRKCVGDWMSAVATKELFAVYSHMGTEDVADDLGPAWTLVWEMLVQNESPEVVLRSSECFVDASDMARPNRDRITELLTQLQQYVVPILAQHLAQVGDPNPLNGFLRAFGDAANIDVESFVIPPPSDDPNQQQTQQQQAELAQQLQQAQIAKMNADAGRLNAETQAVAARVENERLATQAKIWQAQQGNQGKQAEQQFRLTAVQQGADLKLAAAQQAALLKQQAAEHSAQLRERDAALKAQQTEHDMSLREREADAMAHVTAVQAVSRQHADQAKLATQVDLSQQQADRHIQTMQEREAAARQSLLLKLIEKKQAMQLAEAAHTQQSWHLDDAAKAEAEHSAMIANSKLLSAATQAAFQARRQGE